jgi:hypothetical protein
MPVARAAFFATRLSPAPVLRIVRFAAFTTFFFVLDFLRLAILFPPIRYLVGPSPRLWIRVWSCRDGPGLVRLLSPVLRVVETTGSHRHTHTALAATQRVCAVTCSDCYRCDYPDAGTTSRSRRVAAPLCGAGGAVTRSRSIANRLYSGSRLLGGGGPKRARVRKSTAESQEVHPDCLPATGLRPNLN